MNPIKPIETSYQGYRFRSRLEARWAVFFDCLNVRYEYEKDGYDLDGTWYLPDFFLPDIYDGTWIEVKPLLKTPTHNQQLMPLLCEKTGNYGMVVEGEPMESWLYAKNMTEGTNIRSIGIDRGSSYTMFMPLIQEDGSMGNGGDWPYIFCVCPVCHTVGIEFNGWGDRICSSSKCGNIKKTWTGDHDLIFLAALAARGKRF